MTPRTASAHWCALIACLVAFSGLFVATYPRVTAIEDEIGFMNQTLVWSRGALSSEAAGLGADLADFFPIAGRHVPGRHPGRSLVALPFYALFGYRAVFASGLILHLATAAVAAILLQKLGKSPLYAALVLFHPTLALYSRTLMADGASGLGILIAALGAVIPNRKGAALAGLGVGIAALMRYYSALAIIPILAHILIPPRPPRALSLAIIAAATAGALGAAIAVYDLAIYHRLGDPFTFQRGFFTTEGALDRTLFYAFALMVLWPAMLAAPLFDRSPIKRPALLLIAVFLPSAGFYYFHDKGPNLAQTLVVGLRLLQSILPVWIVSYASTLDDRVKPILVRIFGKIGFAAFVAAGIAALFAATAFMFATHQKRLASAELIREDVARSIPDGSLVVSTPNLIRYIGSPAAYPRYHQVNHSYYDMVFDNSQRIALETKPWFLAILLENAPSDALPDHAARVVEQYRMTRVPVRTPGLLLFKGEPPTPTPTTTAP